MSPGFCLLRLCVDQQCSPSLFPLPRALSYEIMSPETLGRQHVLPVCWHQSNNRIPCLCALSYEIMSPETIGLQRHDEAGIVLGKHSGR